MFHNFDEKAEEKGRNDGGGKRGGMEGKEGEGYITNIMSHNLCIISRLGNVFIMIADLLVPVMCYHAILRHGES